MSMWMALFFLLVDLQLHARRRACYNSCMQSR